MTQRGRCSCHAPSGGQQIRHLVWWSDFENVWLNFTLFSGPTILGLDTTVSKNTYDNWHAKWSKFELQLVEVSWVKQLTVLSTLETKKCMRFDPPQRRIEKIKHKGKFQSKWKAEFEAFSNKKISGRPKFHFKSGDQRTRMGGREAARARIQSLFNFIEQMLLNIPRAPRFF